MAEPHDIELPYRTYTVHTTLDRHPKRETESLQEYGERIARLLCFSAVHPEKRIACSGVRIDMRSIDNWTMGEPLPEVLLLEDAERVEVDVMEEL